METIAKEDHSLDDEIEFDAEIQKIENANDKRKCRINYKLFPRFLNEKVRHQLDM